MRERAREIRDRIIANKQKKAQKRLFEAMAENNKLLVERSASLAEAYDSSMKARIDRLEQSTH